jgi:hypothetical protein
MADSDLEGAISGWELSPFGDPAKLFQATDDQVLAPPLGISADGTRKLIHLYNGVADPAYPTAGGAVNLYDISGGSADLVSLLPSGVPACVGAEATEAQETPMLSDAWIADDGSRAYFTSIGDVTTCNGPRAIFMRDFGPQQTVPISGSPISGLDCDSYLLRANGDDVYFFSSSRLAADDTAPSNCSVNGNGSNADIYRYRLSDGSRQCVTCALPGGSAHIYLPASSARSADRYIGLAPDGSRIYFHSGERLLPDSPQGKMGIYGLEVETGDLDLVAPVGQPVEIGIQTQERERYGVSEDGTVLTFRSDSESLNAIGGTTNGGTPQYYRYDDEDRSFTCISCPLDGSKPVAVSNSKSPASGDGSTIAFATPTALVNADQNSPKAGLDARIGTDIYEWRDGRLLLVTDGLTSWPTKGSSSSAEAPRVAAVGPSGRDIYFSAPISYTLDALDGYTRLYDARIGGGIDLPPPPIPCPLEVCQGTPKGTPEEPLPGTSSFRGPGNPPASSNRCPRGKVRKKGKCVKRKVAHKKGKSQQQGRKHKRSGENDDRRLNR